MFKETKIVFWGSSEFSVICLDTLLKHGIKPDLVIATPDKPVGRKLVLTPNLVKVWAQEHTVPYITPIKLDQTFINNLTENFSKNSLYLVASYGKIIPTKILSIPQHKILNIHPSLLPKYRGPAPLQEQILKNEKDIGVSIMTIDDQVDHGPIIAKEAVKLAEWPTNYHNFEREMAILGTELFIKILNGWITGEIQAKEQDHTQATITKKVVKSDGEVKIDPDSDNNPESAWANYLKILAYHDWPKTFFLTTDKKGQELRVVINSASFKDGQLIIEKVTPAGKKEMSYKDFQRGQTTL